METDVMNSTSHVLVASDRVEGTPVRRRNGAKIGTIQRLMVEKRTGKVAYAVMTFGGFMGFGQRHLPIAWELLHYDPQLQAYQVDLNDAELACANSDAEFDWGERVAATDSRIRAYGPNHWGAY